MSSTSPLDRKPLVIVQKLLDLLFDLDIIDGNDLTKATMEIVLAGIGKKRTGTTTSNQAGG